MSISKKYSKDGKTYTIEALSDNDLKVVVCTPLKEIKEKISQKVGYFKPNKGKTGKACTTSSPIATKTAFENFNAIYNAIAEKSEVVKMVQDELKEVQKNIEALKEDNESLIRANQVLKNDKKELQEDKKVLQIAMEKELQAVQKELESVQKELESVQKPTASKNKKAGAK